MSRHPDNGRRMPPPNMHGAVPLQAIPLQGPGPGQIAIANQPAAPVVVVAPIQTQSAIFDSQVLMLVSAGCPGETARDKVAQGIEVMCETLEWGEQALLQRIMEIRERQKVKAEEAAREAAERERAGLPPAG